MAVVFSVFVLALHLKKGELEARTLAFTTLVFSNIMLIITNLSYSQSFFKIIRKKNNALWVVISVALVALVMILYVPFLRNIFHFAVLSADDLFICLFAGVFSLIWFEGLKLLNINRAHTVKQ